MERSETGQAEIDYSVSRFLPSQNPYLLITQFAAQNLADRRIHIELEWPGARCQVLTSTTSQTLALLLFARYQRTRQNYQ